MEYKNETPRVIIYKKTPDKKGHLSHKNAPGPHHSSRTLNRSFQRKVSTRKSVQTSAPIS